MNNFRFIKIFTFLILASLSMLPACSDNISKNQFTYYSIGGVITGLVGTGLTLQKNGKDTISVSGNTFTFSEDQQSNTDYNVTIVTQPISPTQTCEFLTGANGRIKNAAVTNISINCIDHYSIGGTVTGLQDVGELTLLNNNVNELTVTKNGKFSFSENIVDGGAYNITVSGQPVDKSCSVSNRKGTVQSSGISDILVICSDAYSIRGMIYGLQGELTLNNLDDRSSISNSNPQIGLAFGFDIQLTQGQQYNVSVESHSNNQFCTILNSIGLVGAQDISNISITCLDPALPHYSKNGSGWNRYVKNDGSTRVTAMDTPCEGTEVGYHSCINGGEIWSVPLWGKSSCNGVTARDSLNNFRWTCDDSGTQVKVVSLGLNEQALLSDLIDFVTTPPQWKKNAVIINQDALSFAKTPVTAWLSILTSITEQNAQSSVNTAVKYEVYAITQSTTANYIFDVDGVSIVTRPGVTLSGAGNSIPVIDTSSKPNFIWIEANIDSSGDNGVIFDANHSVIKNLTIQYSMTTGLVSSAKNSVLKNITVTNSGIVDELSFSSGIESSFNATNNVFQNIRSANNFNIGIRSDGSNDTWVNVNISNNRRGFALLGYNNRIINLTSNNNFVDGMAFVGTLGQPSNNLLIDASITNNEVGGLTIVNRETVSLMNVAIVSNAGSRPGGESLAVSNSGGIAMFNSVISNNGGRGILGGAVFTGIFKFGMNPQATCLRCFVPPSDPIVTYDVDASLSFVALTGVNDSVNTSFFPVGRGIRYIDGISDWINFDHNYKSWGKAANFKPFPDPANRSYCRTGATCVIWDWGLNSGDTGDAGLPTLLNQLALPSELPLGKKTSKHKWFANDVNECALVSGATWDVIEGCYSIYLRNAIEVMDDYIGNDNGLCESNEHCLFTPNIASYQGHGDLAPSGIFNAGTLSNITLIRFTQNGY